MTEREQYDVIVVGARCAGSATAMLLARRGHSVLLVDRDAFPSDMPASTHLVWQSGVARLAQWGLLERLKATNCPAAQTVSLDLGGLVLRGRPRPAGGTVDAYAPRRLALDSILLDAAREAGVEFHAGFAVRGLLESNERVCGVSGTDTEGSVVEARAQLVAGADGTSSVVARAVNAAVLDEHPHLQGVVWSYFTDVPVDGLEFFARPGRMFLAWATNDGRTLVGSCVRYEDYAELAKDPDVRVRAELLSLAPSLGARVEAGQRDGRWLTRATQGVRRQASGPGWALVGDAGITMDPITAAGITNALRDAELLSDAIHSGLAGSGAVDEAVARFGPARDAISVPLYEFARETARLDPPSQLVMDLFSALPGQQDAIDAYFGVMAQTVPVTEFFSPDNLTRIIRGSNTSLERALNA
jgi:flavin-dependent dehydrogenase